MCAYLSRCVDEAFGTSSLKRRFVGLKFLWVLRLAPKATLALLRLVDTGLAAHQTLFVHASLNLFGAVASAEDF